uniref:Uncharacterized protein n=1 Tax=viral metagenome TaxID=1070528 RepID=A0A6C0F8Q9_9ZZZZ
MPHCCCICNKATTDPLIPLSCFIKYLNRGHKVCQSCWWDPVIGFALESTCHACPGCEKKIDLPFAKMDPTIVDLTTDE